MMCLKVIIVCKHFRKTFITGRWFQLKVFSGHTGVHHFQDDKNVLHTFNTSREQERNRKLIPKYWVGLRKFLSWLHYMCWIEAPPPSPGTSFLPLNWGRAPFKLPSLLPAPTILACKLRECRSGNPRLAGGENSKQELAIQSSHFLTISMEKLFEILQLKDQDNSQLWYFDDTILYQL